MPEVLERARCGDTFPRRHRYVGSEIRSRGDVAQWRLWMSDRRAEQERFQGKQMYDMLTDALQSLSSVREITLEASVIVTEDVRRGPEYVNSVAWRLLWGRAIQAYHILMLAIADSEPCLESLTIFQQTKKCSVPTHEVGLFLQHPRNAERFTRVAKQLKHLSISLSTTVMPIRPRTEEKDLYGVFDIVGGTILEASDERVDKEADFQGVVNMLQLMESLESLHIHLFNTTRYQPHYPYPYRGVLRLACARLALSSAL